MGLLDATGAEWIDGNLAPLAKMLGHGAKVFDSADTGERLLRPGAVACSRPGELDGLSWRSVRV